MMKVGFAAMLAVVSVISSVNPAFATCSYGPLSSGTTVMNGSFNSGFTECSITNLGITFKARAWMLGTCQLGKGCRSAAIMRSDSNCGWAGIGAQLRATKVNYATGVIQQDALFIATPNTWACNNQVTQSQVAPDNWLLGVKCKIGVACS